MYSIACGAVDFTCAAHSTVEMSAHFPAAHFVDVISPPVHYSAPGLSRSPQSLLHFGHPVVFLRRAKADRAGLSLKRPHKTPLCFFRPVCNQPSQMLLSLRAAHGGKETKKTQGRVGLQLALCHKPIPLVFCEVSSILASAVRSSLCVKTKLKPITPRLLLGGTSLESAVAHYGSIFAHTTIT